MVSPSVMLLKSELGATFNVTGNSTIRYIVYTSSYWLSTVTVAYRVLFPR